MSIDAGAFEGGRADPVRDDLPEIGALFEATFEDVRQHVGGYAMAALGFAAVQLPLTLGSIVLLYVGMFVGMVPGLQSGDDELVSTGMLVGGAVGVVALMLALFVVLPPMQASLLRAVWAHQTRGEPLGFGSAFSTALQDLPRVYLLVGLMTVAVLLGALACYLPAILVGIAFHFAWPLAVIGHRSPFAALGQSTSHVGAHLGWNLKVWGVTFLAGMVLAYVPLVGTAAAILCGGAFNLRAARAAGLLEVEPA